MDKEVSRMRLHGHPKLEQSSKLDKDHVIIDREVYNALVLKFGQNWFGYHKLQGEPPLVTPEEVVYKEIRTPTGDMIAGKRVVLSETEVDIEATLKAQRDSDIKWMREGRK